jgi:hypothetical protein
MWADYYVRTNDPWLLALAAAYDHHKSECWDTLNFEVDGDADYTISASIYHYEEYGEDEGPDYCEFILEVFPESDEGWLKRTEGKPIYASIEDALSAGAIERARTAKYGKETKR